MARIGASGTGGASSVPNYIYAYGFIGLNNVPLGQMFIIPIDYFSIVVGPFTINGDLEVTGDFLIL